MFQTSNQYSFQDISPPILAHFFRDNANSWRDVFSSTMGLKSLRYSTPFDHQILGLIKHIVPLNPPVDHNNAVIICNNYRNNI